MNRQDAEVAKNLEWEESGEELDELAHRVIGAAIEVHRLVGAGFLEREQRSAKHGSIFSSATVWWSNSKQSSRIAPIHVAQTLSYLKTTRLRLGLLINFNVTTLRRGIKRVIHTPQNLGGLGVLAVRPS